MSIISILLLWSLSLSESTCPWESIYKDNKMEIFTRCSETSSVKEIKVIQEVNTDLSVLINTLNDVEAYTSWVYKCIEAKIVENEDDKTFYYYTSTDMPFPASDRDLVVHTTQWYDENGVFYSVSKAAPDKIETEHNMVRVSNFESQWKIEEIAPEKIKIEYVLSTDPGGFIPKWMINMGISIGPKKTMKALVNLVKKREEDIATASSN